MIKKNLDDYKWDLFKFIVDKPKVLKCKYQGLYCQKCLDEYQIYNWNICPKCRKGVDSKQPKKSFLKGLNELRMKCCQCKLSGLYSKYAEHYSKECCGN